MSISAHSNEQWIGDDDLSHSDSSLGGETYSNGLGQLQAREVNVPNFPVSDTRYQLMSLDARFLLELHSISVLPEALPDLAEEIMITYVMELKEGIYHQIRNKKKKLEKLNITIQIEKSERQRLAMERLAQIERTERQVELLERHKTDLEDELHRLRVFEMEAVSKVTVLEARVEEREKEIDSFTAEIQILYNQLLQGNLDWETRYKIMIEMLKSSISEGLAGLPLSLNSLSQISSFFDHFLSELFLIQKQSK